MSLLRPFGERRVRRARGGVTLVELMVSLAIIGLLLALTLRVCWPLIWPAGEFPDLPNAVVVGEHELAVAEFKDQPLQLPSEPTNRAGRPQWVPNQYLVRFSPAVANPAAEADRLVAAHPGGKVLNVYDDDVLKGCNVYIPGITPGDLRGRPSVIGVEQDGYCYLSADTTPTGVKRISSAGAVPVPTQIDPLTLGLPAVSGSLVKTTTSKVVAVIDTGIDGKHVDLRVVRSVGFGYSNGNDQNGHGTHVAGIIGAKVNNRGVVGVYPAVSLWSLRVLSASGSGTYGDVAKALQYVRSNASQVAAANMSLGGGYSQMINDLVDACVDAGVVMVVAAGNERADAQSSTPASAPKAITVSALCDTDGRYGGIGPSSSLGKDDTFATFSNYGTRVDVIAPGVNILSTLPKNRYGSLSGTSMAAPHVAGLMGMYRDSTVNTPSGTRRAQPLEILSLLVSNIGVELIPGRYDSRNYPLLIGR